MWEFIFIGVAILVGANIVLRLIYGDTVTGKYWRKKGYDKGYRDGSTNVKMYYTMKDTLPSVSWIEAQSGKHLNSRSKIDDALKEEE
tara:strand:- start:39 stop:299 length:261 start_codon:yes stop_codon:yes gene_type:complete